MKHPRIVLKNLTAILILSAAFLFLPQIIKAQDKDDKTASLKKTKKKKGTVLYGQASFYANKFRGRKTATGEIFSQEKFTAACNTLPLGTWIQVTNLKNGKIIVVRTNDRLHPKTKRLVDLTRAGAKKLGYISHGLTRVKVEVLNQKLYR